MPVTQKFLPIEEVNAIIAGLRRRPEFAGVESATAAEYQDWTGEDALRVTVLVDESLGADVEGHFDEFKAIKSAIRKVLEGRGETRWVYFTWSTAEEERQSATEDGEDWLS